MIGFLKSLLFSQEETDAEKQTKDNEKKFDILKYDGIRAHQMGRLDYAAKCFTEALSLHAEAETMEALRVVLVAQGKMEQALDVAERMETLEPERTDIQLAKIDLLFQMEKLAEVVAACEALATRDAENALVYYYMARAKWQTNDAAGALAALDKALALKDEFVEAYLLRGRISYETGDAASALPDANSCLSLAPEEEEAFLLRAKVHESLGDTHAAHEDYQAVLTLNPFHEEANIRFGGLLMKEERAEDALAFFDEMIENLPHCSRAYAGRSKVKQQIGDEAGAAEDLEMCQELQRKAEEEGSPIGKPSALGQEAVSHNFW